MVIVTFHLVSSLLRLTASCTQSLYSCTWSSSGPPTPSLIALSSRSSRALSTLCEMAFYPHSLQCQLYHGPAWLVLSSPCFGVRRQNLGCGRPGSKSHSFDLNTSWLRSQLSGPDSTHCQVLTRDVHCVPWGRSLRCVLRSCWEPLLQASLRRYQWRGYPTWQVGSLCFPALLCIAPKGTNTD